MSPHGLIVERQGNGRVPVRSSRPLARLLKSVEGKDVTGTMATQRKAPHQLGIGPVEHELTVRLERAHELGERAARSNDVAQLEIARAREIAEELTRIGDSRGRR